MRLARKLFLLVGMALTAVAMTATSASAQFEVYDEHNNNEHCPAVVPTPHGATGGCHVEFESVENIVLHAYIPQKVTVMNCEVYFEGRIDELGEGYLTEMVINPPHSGAVACTRAACDEVEGVGNHPEVPWPVHLIEHSAGDEELEMELCLRQIAAGEGGARGWCELHFDFTSLGGHQYRIGQPSGTGDGTEEFCENNPGTGYMGPHPLTPAPTSFEAQFATTGTEEIGILH